jgi:hypothetical protein
LALDKFSRENIENRSILDDRIGRDIAQGNVTQDFSLFHLFGGKSHNS